MPYHDKQSKNVLRQVFHRIRGSIYRNVAPLQIEAWVTPEPVPYAERTSGVYKKLQIGDSWGKLWDCAWFRFTGRVPEVTPRRTPAGPGGWFLSATLFPGPEPSGSRSTGAGAMSRCLPWRATLTISVCTSNGLKDSPTSFSPVRRRSGACDGTPTSSPVASNGSSNQARDPGRNRSRTDAASSFGSRALRSTR